MKKKVFSIAFMLVLSVLFLPNMVYARDIEYTLNKMSMYDVDTREEYLGIPKEQFLVEVDVTNNCSDQIDAIMLVQYSADGQMLGLQYLYGKTNIGESYVFGAMVDNSDGNIGCIKAFVVPTIGNMVPLANTLTIGQTTDVTNVLGYTVIPTNGAENVKRSVSVQLVFDDPIIPANGQTLTTAWVRSNVVLRENTATGSTVDYSASISSNGKVLTVDPVSVLKSGTEYQLTVNANAFRGKNNGLLNEGIAVLFTTEGVINTDVLRVEVETNSTSAELSINYDYSEYDEDVDTAYMTVYYRKDGGTWKTLSTCKDVQLSSNLYGTKTVTISNLDAEETYEFEVEVELYDDLRCVDTKNYMGSFTTAKVPNIAISTISVSGATGSSDYIYYDEFVYDDGVFVGELQDTIEPSRSLSYDYGRLKIKVNTDDSEAVVYIKSDVGHIFGSDNKTLYINISEDEYNEECVILYITIVDSSGYETFYELYVQIDDDIPENKFTMDVVVKGNTATITVEGNLSPEDGVRVMMWVDGKYSYIGNAEWNSSMEKSHIFTFVNSMNEDYEFAFLLIVNGEVQITDVAVLTH